MKKRGQFYIIAAVIIIAVFVGIAALTNYARVSKKEVKIYDLGDELGIETGYVYDYGVYNDQDFEILTEEWTNNYIEYTKKQEIIEDWIFVYGDEAQVTAATFSLVTSGTVGLIIGTGGSSVNITTIAKTKQEDIDVTGETEVTVKVPPENFEYSFELKEGENFFFILTSEEAASTS